MNLKKTYNPAKGFTPLCVPGSCSLNMLGFGMIELAPGDEIIFDTKENETAFIILSGRCTMEYDNVRWENIGIRRNVFEGKATAAYVGRRKSIRITTDWHVKIAVCQTHIEEDTGGFLILPQDVRSGILGQGTWRRENHFIFDGNTPTKRLTIGEAFIFPGNWAGFPPHKHEIDNMPTEGVLEEIYYFLFDPPQGFGVQLAYASDGEFEEAYIVKSDDLVEFPRGYHSTVGAPGYNAYFLWMMAGEHKGFFRVNDPKHHWVAAVENMLKKMD